MAVKITDAKVLNEVQVMLVAQTELARRFRDLSAMATKGTPSINVPVRDPRDAQSFENGAPINYVARNSSYHDDILMLNDDAGDIANYAINDDLENVFDTKGDAVTDILKAISVEIDNIIAKRALVAAQTVGAKNADFFLAVLTVRTAVKNALLNPAGMVAVLSVEDEGAYLADPRLQKVQSSGAGSDETGTIRTILGMSIECPSGLTELTESFFAHTLGIAYAFQGPMTVLADQNLANKTVQLHMSVKFGVKALRLINDNENVQNGKSTYIFKWGAIPTPG